MTSLKPSAKLSSEARRAAIIKAVRKLFAEKGFHGTTTRELADAAGVSEALLFKHFPNKEALYSAMQLSCCKGQDQEKIERLRALAPSTGALVFLIHFMVSHTLTGRKTEDAEETLHCRIMLRSLTEDGEFARHFVNGMPAEGNRKIEACIKAAGAAGDLVDGPLRANLGGWFAQHLVRTIKVHLLPAKPVIDYGVPRDKLVDQTVRFILRGIGVKDTAIKRYYNPQALAQFAD